MSEVAATCSTYNNPISIPPFQINLTKPAGVAVGDLMIATTRYTAFYSSVSTPSGWTELLDNGSDSTTWYKFVQAGDPSSWGFGTPAGPAAGVGGITAFTGVKASTPFAGATPYGTMLTTGTAATFNLPNDAGTVAGSMRFSSVVSGAGVTNTFAGMTEGCDQKQGSVAYSSAWEPTGAGATTTRTDARSGTGAQVSFTYVINPAVSPCGSGGQTLTSPASVTFPSTVLDGLDKSLSATPQPTLTVDDESGSGSGWNVSGTSTTFTSGGNTLPTGATTLLGVTPTAGTGNCSMPTNGIGYPVTLPAAATAPAAVKLFNAAAGTGAGPTNLGLQLQLAFPSTTRVGLYSSTWTLTLATGP